MKKYILSLATLSLFLACGEQKTENTAGLNSSIVATTEPQEGFVDPETKAFIPDESKGETSIEFMEMSHKFGDVLYPSENLYTFKFKNTGNLPLIIESATASCGCTVPNTPDAPIQPGETGELDVIFRPNEGQTGQLVTKKVNVVSNTNPKETHLEISANVMKPMLGGK